MAIFTAGRVRIHNKHVNVLNKNGPKQTREETKQLMTI